MAERNSRRLAVVLVFLVGAAGAVTASWTPAVNAAGLGPVRAVVTPSGTPAPGGDRGASVELGVMIAPKPTGTVTQTPVTPTPVTPTPVTPTPVTPSPTTVTPSTTAPTDPPGDGGDLPRTGMAVGAFVVVGAALVGGGAAVRLLGRRRQRPTSHPPSRR